MVDKAVKVPNKSYFANSELPDKLFHLALTWPQGYKRNSCSIQLSIEFFLLINVKNCWHFDINEHEEKAF